jgi:cobalt/nickel transport system permease protein
MHIPDGFLSTPVWAGLDALAVPAAGLFVRRAQRGFDQSRTPLLGVMGAFVFAAQMINFPVGAGTSGHLVGAALLACTLGPSAAAVTMTAILAIQALVFQDGGILALGANVLNMAVFGVLAAYLPYHFWGAGKWRRPAIFAGGVLSVLVSAVLAITELSLSGIRIPTAVLGVSLALFLVAAVLEGAITVAVAGALETMQPDFVRNPSGRRSYALGALAAAAILFAAAGVLIASTHPDGLEKLAGNIGIASLAKVSLAAPLAGYEASLFNSPWLRKATAGLTGLGLIFGACLVFGRYAARKRSGA